MRLLQFLFLFFGLVMSGLRGFSQPLVTQESVIQSARNRDAVPSLRVDHIGVGEGLTQGSVYHMLQDSRGFLWLGTQDGLNRFDGDNFTHYRPDPVNPSSIVGINISGIVEDPQGNLWVGTEFGLNRYDRATDRFSFISTNHINRKSLKSKTVPFYADQREVLYYCEADGLVSLNTETKQKTILQPDIKPTQEYDQLNSTVRTATGDVWLHASTGIIRYDLRNHQVHHYFSSHPRNELGPATGIFSFHCDQLGILWLGTANGLIRFNVRTETYETFTPGDGVALTSIYTIAEDRDGRLWLGTQRTGIWLFEKSTGAFTQLSRYTDSSKMLSDYEICKIYIDRQGIIWANADPDGLARIVPGSSLFGGMIAQKGPFTDKSPTSLSNFVVRGFLETDSNTVWVATERSIDVLNRTENRVVRRYLSHAKHSDLPSRTLIKCLFQDPAGRIWIGSNGGVFLFNKNRETFTKILLPGQTEGQVVENFVRRMIALDANTIIAATENGLYKLDAVQQTLTALPILPNQNIFGLMSDRSGRYWIGTYSAGFYCFDKSPFGAQTAPQRVVHGLDGYTVLSFYEDTLRPIMWIATDHGLVALNTKTGKLRLYDQKDGLPNPFVYSILPDRQNRLWISSNRGLSCFDPKTGKFKNFDPSDGLQGYEFNGNAYYRTHDGELYFGGVNGFNRFYPERFRTSSYSPGVHIYNLIVNDEGYDIEKYIGETSLLELPYNHNKVALEFAALDYYSSGRNVYQYQLVGYDDQWVNAGNDTYVRYTHLPPGSYTFQVRAANKDGQWSPNVRQLQIVVRPPFWRQFWFMTLAALMVLVVGYLWLRRRERIIHGQHQVNTRLAVDLQEQIKKNLARDLHDEIGTQLATLKLYVGRLTDLPGQPLQATTLGNNARQLISDIIANIRNLLRELSPRTLEQYGYAAAVQELLSRIDESTLETHFWADQLPERLDHETELMLYRITQELLNNTLKHANARQARIRLIYEDHLMKLYYNDDGQGFDYKCARQGLGIGNIESRVALLNGRIEWQTAPGAGTRVLVELPFRPSHRFLSLKRLEESFRRVTTEKGEQV